MERVFVTGAHGLLGRWLVEALLHRGADVALLRRTPGRPSALTLAGLEDHCRVVPGALADVAALDAGIGAHRSDTVFHLAAQSVAREAERDPVATFATNVRGTWDVLESCRRHGVARVVVASSAKVYGPRAPLPHREDAPLEGTSAYAASKACADLAARAHHHTYGLPVAVARASNVYGPGDLERSRLVPELVAAAIAGRAPVVRSDGSPERDFLFASDAVAAYLAVAGAIGRGAEGEAFNVGGDRPHTVRDVVSAVLEVAGAAVAPEYRGTPAAPGEVDRAWVDCGKLRALTGWTPRVALRDGLRATVAWSRAHPGALAG